MNYEEFLLNCDGLIKNGKINVVSEKVRSLNLSQVPRNYRQALGKICRRSGLIDSGLRLLHPVIRNEKALEVPATAVEICEYAVLLSRNGSILEALDLLELVNENEAPEALLYRGFCHVSNWNYQQAAADFEKFLSSHADSYSKLIARVNLVAAYVANGQLEAADSLLTETVSHAQEHKAARLVGNCYELRAQVAFFRGQFDLARAELKQSLEVFLQSGSYDQLLVQKWYSTMEALESQSIEPLTKFCKEALARKHWESVRDTDFYRMKISFDQNRFDHLMFGTPSQFYRERVQKELAQKPSDFYIFGKDSNRLLDMQTGLLPGSDEISGNKIHQMISALLSDYYAPSNIGKLFAHVYPNEYFDIDSSPARVRQILRRTRRWLEASSIPARIEENKGSYNFVLTGEFGIRIPFERVTIDGKASQWHKVLSVFRPGESFTAELVCQRLQISRTSFHRLSIWAIENQLLTKSGINKATVYCILENKLKSSFQCLERASGL